MNIRNKFSRILNEKNIETEPKIKRDKEKIKRVISSIKMPLNRFFGLIERASFGIKYVAFLLVLFLAIFGANKLRFEFWREQIRLYHPELLSQADEKGIITYLSPFDKMKGELDSRVNGQFFLYFLILIGLFLDTIWVSYGNSKPQVISKER